MSATATPKNRDTYVGSQTRIAGLESPRNLDSRRRGGTAPGNIDLSTANVELGNTAGRVVDANALNAEQIFTILDALGNGGRVRSCKSQRQLRQDR